MTLQRQLYRTSRRAEGASMIGNHHPSDLNGRFAQVAAADPDIARVATRQAPPVWWAAGLQRRHDILMAIGTEGMAPAGDIGRSLLRQDGKPRGEGRGQVYRKGQFLTHVAAEMLRPPMPPARADHHLPFGRCCASLGPPHVQAVRGAEIQPAAKTSHVATGVPEWAF